MKVAFVSHSKSLGGAEACLLELLDGILDAGVIEPTVVVPALGDLSAALDNRGVPVEVIPHKWWARRDGIHGRPLNLRSTKMMASLFRNRRFDIVVTNTLVAPAGAFAAALTRTPHVWYAHEYGDADHGFNFQFGYRRSLKIVDRLSKLVIANSEAVKNHLVANIPAAKIRKISYAIDIPVGNTKDAVGSTALFLCLGRVAPTKGQADAIRALANVDNANLRIVGGGTAEYLEELERLAQTLGVSERVEFVHHADPIEHLDEADVLLMCSRNEAFGRVTVEAMKRARPVIGTRAGGTAELITEGEHANGLLYEPGNIEQLSVLMNRLARDPAERLELAKNAQAFAVSTFSRQRYAAAFTAVIKEALADK